MIVAESVVEQQPLPDVPGFLAPDAWGALDDMIDTGDYWEMLLPSTFALETPAVKLLARQMGVSRRDDPLMLVHELNQRLFDYFEYVPRSTRVDSPIDEAIVSGKGVCQDFAHTMIALLRHVRIPARYVSGYLYRSREDHDRSTPDATHAWVEALLPHLGWVGFDPTNNLVAHHRHIRTAVGRDYADVPPTHGIFRGKTASELYVAVQVREAIMPPDLDRKLPIPEDWSVLVERAQQPPSRPRRSSICSRCSNNSSRAGNGNYGNLRTCTEMGAPCLDFGTWESTVSAFVYFFFAGIIDVNLPNNPGLLAGVAALGLAGGPVDARGDGGLAMSAGAAGIWSDRRPSTTAA